MSKETMGEVPQGNPTEASKGFLGGWYTEVLFGLNIATLGVSSVLAGMAVESGNMKLAISRGVSAGCMGAAAFVFRAAENRFLKDQVKRAQSQDR